MSAADLRRRIADVMAERGLTQAALGEALGRPQSTISGWLTRNKLPDAAALMRLPAALDVSGHWLLTEEGPRERVGADVRTALELARAEFALELEAAARRVLSELLEKMRTGLFAAVAKQLSPAPTPEQTQRTVRAVAAAAAAVTKKRRRA